MFKMLATDTTNKRKGKPVCVLRGLVEGRNLGQVGKKNYFLETGNNPVMTRITVQGPSHNKDTQKDTSETTHFSINT